MESKKKPRSNARDKTGAPRRVYSFGCKRPDDDTMQFLRRQAMMAKDVQAAMIRNENSARARREECIAVFVPEYAEAREDAKCLEGLIGGCYDEMNAIRKKQRTRVECPDIERKIAELKEERVESWRHAAEAKRPALKQLSPSWEELKRRKALYLEKSGSSSSRAKQLAHKLALASMLEKDAVPELWRALAGLEDDQNDKHCAIRRVDWRPDDAKPEIWADPLDGDTKEMAREAFLQSASRTAMEGGRMRIPRGATGRVGRMWGAESAPIIRADNFIQGSAFSLQIATNPLGEKADPKSRRSQLRKRMVATLKIAGQDVAVPVLVHRQVPEGGLVRRAWFILKPRGRIELQLVVQHEAINQRHPGKRLGAVAVKPGWSTEEAPVGELGAVRVATWLGTDGATGAVELDAKTNEALVEITTLRSHQDEHHSEALGELCEWVAFATEKPDWLDEEMKHVHSWKSPRHLASIAFKMRGIIGTDEQRETIWHNWKHDCDLHGADYFLPLAETRRWLQASGVTGEAVVMAVYLEWWRRKNRHLREWECNMRETALRRRREAYRVAAAWLAKRYEQLLLLDVGLKRAARKKAPEQKIEGPEKLWTRQRRNACPSQLIESLTNAFRTTAPKVRVKAKTLNEALEAQGFSIEIPTGGAEVAAE